MKNFRISIFDFRSGLLLSPALYSTKTAERGGLNQKSKIKNMKTL